MLVIQRYFYAWRMDYVGTLVSINYPLILSNLTDIKVFSYLWNKN